MSGSENGADLGSYIKRRRRRRFGGVLLAVVLAAPPIALLLSGRAFDIEAAPARASATASLHRVEGLLLILGSRILLFSQKGAVTLEAEGFVPRSVPIDKNSDRARVRVMLDPLPGVAIIDVDSPVAFELWVDGTSYGASTPVEAELEQGPHTVRIGGAGVKPASYEIDIAGYGETQRFAFQAEPGISSLTVRTAPTNAQVFLNGALVGQGGFSGQIELGEQEAVFRLDGYHEQRRRFIAVAEQGVDLGLIELAPKVATANIDSTPSGASVLLNGQFAGSTPVRIPLEPLRTHHLVVRKVGYDLIETQVAPAPDERIERTFQLGSHAYRASVTSNMEGRVSVNGVDQGPTPASLSVREGDRIEVLRKGYRARPVVVAPVGGDERTYVFKLMRPNEYAYHEAAAQLTLDNGIALRKFPPVHIRLSPAPGQPDQEAGVEKQLTRPFYMGVREIAYREYLEFDARTIPGGLSSNHPVTNLTWSEAARYCNWLSDQEGLTPVYEFDASGELRHVATTSLGYRLPTEAEWEAVSGHDFSDNRPVGPFPWGAAATIPKAFGNFAGRETKTEGRGGFLFDHVDNHKSIAPVASYPANFNGLYDLAGNVAEWVTDYHAPLPERAGQPLVDPLGPTSGIDHLVKGSSFRSNELRVLAIGHRTFVAGKRDSVGFRIARWIY